MTDKEKDQLNELDLQEVIDVLIEEHCISPIVDCIVANVGEKLDKLRTIQELMK